MEKRDRLNVVLFALPGVGNTVLEALLSDIRVNVRAVFTVKYDQPFPYYKERQLTDLCHERGVSCYHGIMVSSDEGIKLLCQHSPDLIVVATFKQILKVNVLKVPVLGVINFHLSLLPRYRGPCPTNAVLYCDENTTGMTIHYVSEKVDEGNILLQKSIVISDVKDDGELRKRMALLAGELTPEVIGLFADYSKPVGSPQNHNFASYAPKPVPEDGYLELATNIDTIRRKMKAYNPMPGTSILIEDERVVIDRYELIQDHREDGVYDNGDSVDLILNSQAIRLFKKIS
jgi:methionyl-tRNA formyltransferase